MQPLLEVIKKNEKYYDLAKIEKAYLYAAELHDGQRRQSGEPYISHPVECSSIVIIPYRRCDCKRFGGYAREKFFTETYDRRRTADVQESMHFSSHFFHLGSAVISARMALGAGRI